VLFLHGAPGLACQLERDRFGDSLPVHWWDQPHFEADQSGAFDLLVDAAVEEVGRLSGLVEKAVALVASSFGAQSALAVIARVPAKISHLSIVGGILDLRTALRDRKNKHPGSERTSGFWELSNKERSRGRRIDWLIVTVCGTRAEGAELRSGAR